MTTISLTSLRAFAQRNRTEIVELTKYGNRKKAGQQPYALRTETTDGRIRTAIL